MNETSQKRFILTKRTEDLWYVTFNNPPLNLIDYKMMQELGDLFAQIEMGNGPAVLVFDSSNPDFFLAHYDVSMDHSFVNVQETQTGLHPWTDILVRLNRLPAVTIAALRGRARMAGSELVLACDIRFASRERGIIGQAEVGFGAIPGGGPASLLPKIVGRGRAFEILLGGEDFDADLAERYGYVNRSISDSQFISFVENFAVRVSKFDRIALRDIKYHVNDGSKTVDSDFAAQMDAFWKSMIRPEVQYRLQKSLQRGFQQNSEAEMYLGEHVGTLDQ